MSKSYLKNFLKTFEKAQIGEIKIYTPEGEELHFKGSLEGLKCDFIIKDWSTITRLIKRGDIGLGEAYFEGMWDSSDVADFLTYCCQNLDYIKNHGRANFFNKILFNYYNKFVRLNTKYGSKKNIIEHYDIGNDFYNLWLDPTMTYSSALRLSSSDDLKSAQLNKYHRIINKLSLKNTNVLEIGCGWGGFAEAAANAGAEVTGITISKNQFDYASKRLSDKANILIQDYRDVSRIYDRIVSIEMFEAVGQRYWPTYFNKIRESLSRNGKAIIQTITIHEDAFNNYKNDSDYIRHYIFPGGMLPSKNKFCYEVQKAKMDVGTIFEFGKDYAWTLREWRKNFVKIRDKLVAMKYSITFIKAWEFYLSMSIAGFESGRTNVMQIEISR